MRAPLSFAALALLLSSAVLVLSYQEIGYHAEDSYQPEDVIDVADLQSACPSERLLRSRETCNVDGSDVQCLRLHCCDTHNFIAGRCIPKSVDPCSLKLCEQACEVKDTKVWCTCHSGFQFHPDNYRRKEQPYCIDIDECATSNGGCEQRCVNDPGGYHCECAPPFVVAIDGKKCERRAPIPVPLALPEPLPLIRASSRCYAPCDTVSWLSRKVKQLSDQLHTTQQALKKFMESSLAKGDGGDQFAEGNYAYRVLDSTAPLEGGYCRCERGPRGPAGPPGMEGPKGDMGPRGPRGARGPKGSMDLMLLMIADIRHDIQNLEARVYKDGERPERFNLQKAWRRQRKQELLERESKTEQDLEAYTAPPLETRVVEVSSNGQTGEIKRESTTDWSLMKGSEPEDSDGALGLLDERHVLEKLRQYHLLDNTTAAAATDDSADTDYDYRGDQFAEGNYAYRVLDSTAPLEGGYCRCERGPRGPAGPPGMEGPKGDMGPRGPRGARGPKGSMDLMLLMIADIRHDIQNLEARVYKDGERPERFNLQKAWRRQRKQELLERESKTEQDLEAYTAPPLETRVVEVSSNGQTGEIKRESTTDWSLMKGSEPEDSDGALGLLDERHVLEKLRQYHLLDNTTAAAATDDSADTDYDYSFY